MTLDRAQERGASCHPDTQILTSAVRQAVLTKFGDLFMLDARATLDTHEHLFAEEQEDSGRLIATPCFVCGLPASDALSTLNAERRKLSSALAAVTAERDQARQMLEDAPHGNGCASIFKYPCNCWKAGR